MGDEISRCSAGGVIASTFVALGIALCPVLMVGSEQMRARVVEPCLKGYVAPIV